MRKAIVLAVGLGLLCVGSAWATPKILDRSVIGYWKFDSGNSSADISGYGGAEVSRGSYMSVRDSGGYANSGYADITSKGKTFTATLGNAAPVFNGTTSPYYTLATRYRASAQIVSGSGDLQDAINDTVNWHFSAERYQPNKITNSGYERMVVLDPRYRDSDQDWYKDNGTKDEDKNKELANNDAKGLVSVSSKSVTIGGSIETGGWFGKTYSFVGGFDETMVINRMMTKRELTRLALTGETYIYAHGNSPSFTVGANWSSKEYNHVPAPGDIVGAAYIVENGQTLSQGSTATFGGDVSKQISLTLGRLAPVSYAVGGVTTTKTAVGNFTQSGSGTAITFYDLRLNDGTYAAGGTSLTTTLLDVDAPASKPFALAATGDFTLNVGEDTTGSGVLAMTGAGKLTVGKWTGTAKLRLAAGSIKTPRLDGYTGGTVIVSDDPVTFTGADTLSGTIQVRYDGTIAAAEATYPVLNAPTLTSAGQVAITAAFPEKYEGAPKLENGVVSLVVTKKIAPLPDEDKGTKPVLLWQ